MGAGEMVGPTAARRAAALGPNCDAMVRRDLAELIRGLGARCAARMVFAAIDRDEWQEIADDVSALARHDDQRCQYVAAQRAARAMGRDDVGTAIDVLCDLTGETAEEWALRVALEMPGALS